MSKYIHLYRTTAAFEDAYKGTDYKEPWVSRTLETESINYNKKEKEGQISYL